MKRSISFAALVTVLSITGAAPAQSSLKGSEFALQSDNTPDGKLEKNGYLGTFIRVESAGDVELIAKVHGTAAGGPPRCTMSVCDSSASLDVRDEASPRLKLHLPTGTYAVRVQLDNAPTGGKSITLDSLEVTGATFVNENTDATALAAADSYIDGFRKGETTLHLDGVTPGTQVHVKLKNHAFNFGAAVSGYEQSMHMEKNPLPGSDAAKYQEKLRTMFNLIVPGNAGKWEYNEKERGNPTMGYIDQLREFAKGNGKRMRMHAMLWDTGQQPEFVKDLLTRAAAGDAAAKADLRKAISDRIAYYVKDRTTSYLEMDVLNESFHQPRYLNIFGVDGIADIFKEVGAAAKASRASTRLCVNEYNLFQWSQVPPYGPNAKGAFDAYASWYREHVEALNAAGANVAAFGVQYYADIRPGIPQPHSAARINQVFQNLSVLGLPISLTEFGVNALPTQPAPTPEQQGAAKEAGGKAMDEAMRMSFGTPAVTTFISWGFWGGDVWDQAPLGTLFDKDWNLTPAGHAWEANMKKWDTDVTVPADSDGTVKFTGFYGEYEVTAGGRKGTFTLAKGQETSKVKLAN